MCRHAGLYPLPVRARSQALPPPSRHAWAHLGSKAVPVQRPWALLGPRRVLVRDNGCGCRWRQVVTRGGWGREPSSPPDHSPACGFSILLHSGVHKCSLRRPRSCLPTSLWFGFWGLPLSIPVAVASPFLPPDWVVGRNWQRIDGHLMPGERVGAMWVRVTRVSSCCLQAVAVTSPGDTGAVPAFPPGAVGWVSRCFAEDGGHPEL